MFLLNPQITWKKKNNVIVVYYDFNYYFFKNKTMQWLELLLKRQSDERKIIPQKFIEYLYKRNIVCYE